VAADPLRPERVNDLERWLERLMGCLLRSFPYQLGATSGGQPCVIQRGEHRNNRIHELMLRRHSLGDVPRQLNLSAAHAAGKLKFFGALAKQCPKRGGRMIHQ
jgi:hypothetical protein